MADAADSKSAGSDTLWVQVPSPVFLVYPVLDRLFYCLFSISIFPPFPYPRWSLDGRFTISHCPNLPCGLYLSIDIDNPFGEI